MTRHIRYEEEPAEGAMPSRPSFAGPGGALYGVVVGGVAIAGILYAAALAISRTPGFRQYVANDLEARWGADVSVASARLTPGLELAMDGVAVTGAAGQAFLRGRADRVRVGGWFGGRNRIVVTGGEAEWRLDEAEAARTTNPPARIGAWLAVALDLIPANPETHGIGPALELRGCSAVWRGTDGKPAAEAAGLLLHWTPVEVPGRRFVHVRAHVQRLRRPGAEAEGPLDLECLLAGEARFDLVPAPRRPTNGP